MSTRKTLVDTIITQLSGISGVNLVTDDPQNWATLADTQHNAIFVKPSTPDSEPIAFPHATAHDREAEMQIELEAVVSSQYAADVGADCDTLMTEIEKVMHGNAAIKALTIYTDLEQQDFAFDPADNLGVITAVYAVDYTYNHNSP